MKAMWWVIWLVWLADQISGVGIDGGMSSCYRSGCEAFPFSLSYAQLNPADFVEAARLCLASLFFFSSSSSSSSHPLCLS